MIHKKGRGKEFRDYLWKGKIKKKGLRVLVSPPQASRLNKIDVRGRKECRLKKEFDIIWGSKSVIWWKDLKDWVKEWREMYFREKGESLRGREWVESCKWGRERASEPYIAIW